MDQSRGGQYTAIGLPLRWLIRMAYQVQDFQIVGGPGWLDSDRFDIIAKDGSAPSERSATAEMPDRGALMLRALLAERFKLIVHKETRDMPIYALVLARSDGRLGPHLRPATIDCSALEDARRRGGNAASPDAPRRDGIVCGTSVGPGVILTGGQSMARLATAFSNLTNTGMSLNRIVVDRTGLSGNFDAELRFTPERIPDFGAGDPVSSVPGVQPIDPNGASIFTAVQEQLGLKLDSQRGPVDVLVIDRAEQPTEN
jgi:uncharacterized protein (TIGR03435 family)